MELAVDDILDSSIKQLNELLPTGDPLPKDEAVILLGPGAVLDSMSFVNLLVLIEEEIANRSGMNIELAPRIPSDGTTAFTLSDLRGTIGKALEERRSA